MQYSAPAMSTTFDRRAQLRRQENERRLCGETLSAFHARETAKPPTLSEVYARNHTNRERCPWTVDLVEALQSPGRRAPPA